VITISVDEKPGVQAIQNIAPDILPDPEHGVGDVGAKGNSG
jgi:hypothetical protein